MPWQKTGLGHLYQTKFYRVWQNMKTRCDNPNYWLRNRYGARGITYDPKWKTFRGFYEDMYSLYKEGLSLDRIDNDKGYSKDNCRWATPKTQANNKSNNRQITLNGVTKTLAQWIDTVEVKSSTVRQRFYTLGWSIEKSLYTPAQSWHRKRG